ncbi:MAG: hypothetical protein WC479_06430 [Candidatus Izemoplasmatales bacterium]
MVAILVIKRKVKAKTTRRQHVLVQEEVKKGLDEFSKVVKSKFDDTVRDWNEKPTFKVTTKVTKKRWTVSARVVKKTKIGKIFGWVDKGTGSRGGGKDYEIRPKKGKYLSFTVPHNPVTLPNPSIQGFPPVGDPKLLNVEVVHHPGIYPRNFTKTIMTWVKSKEAGAFRSVIEARVKRAFRKISKGVST